MLLQTENMIGVDPDLIRFFGPKGTKSLENTIRKSPSKSNPAAFAIQMGPDSPI